MLFRLQVRPTGPPSLVQLDLGGSGGMPDGFPSPVPEPEVVFLASGPVGAKIEEWSSGLDIVLGASAWAHGAVLLIDPSGHRLGLVRRLP
jgi:hypothetical protein